MSPAFSVPMLPLSTLNPLCASSFIILPVFKMFERPLTAGSAGSAAAGQGAGVAHQTQATQEAGGCSDYTGKELNLPTHPSVHLLVFSYLTSLPLVYAPS